MPARGFSSDRATTSPLMVWGRLVHCRFKGDASLELVAEGTVSRHAGAPLLDHDTSLSFVSKFRGGLHPLNSLRACPSVRTSPTPGRTTSPGRSKAQCPALRAGRCSGGLW